MTCSLNKGVHGSSISTARHGRGAGQFERLIGVMKQGLHRSIGNGTLRWHELEEVIVDDEITLITDPWGTSKMMFKCPI